MAKTVNYRELSSELDDVLNKLQSVESDIDEAVKQYERGMQIIKDLEAYLKTAENKVLKTKVSIEK